jgi:hypothetical protein
MYHDIGLKLPPSMPNSRAFYYRKYKDLTATVEELGMPHLFLTITMNTKDKDLLRFLQKYSDLKEPTV